MRSSRTRCRWFSAIATAAGSSLLAQPGNAQIAGSLSLHSDYLARGYSVTEHRPAVTAAISFDDISGIYANGAMTGSFNSQGAPIVKGMVVNIGYARALSHHVSLDAGYVRTWYFRFADAPGRADADFSEFYLGAIAGPVAYHVYYAPDYLDTGVATLHNEVAGSAVLTGRLRANARIGLTSYLSAPAELHLKSDCRWALGVSHPAGPVMLSLTLDGGQSNLKRSFGDAHPGKTRLVGGATLTF